MLLHISSFRFLECTSIALDTASSSLLKPYMRAAALPTAAKHNRHAHSLDWLAPVTLLTIVLTSGGGPASLAACKDAGKEQVKCLRAPFLNYLAGLLGSSCREP